MEHGWTTNGYPLLFGERALALESLRALTGSGLDAPTFA